MVRTAGRERALRSERTSPLGADRAREQQHPGRLRQIWGQPLQWAAPGWEPQPQPWPSRFAREQASLRRPCPCPCDPLPCRPPCPSSELALFGDPLGLALGCLFVVVTSAPRSAAGPRSILSHTLSCAGLGAGWGVGGGGASRSGLGAVRAGAAPAPALSSAGFSAELVTAARTGPMVAGGSGEGFSSSGHMAGPYSTGAASGRSGPMGRESCWGLSGVCSGLGGAGFSPAGVGTAGATPPPPATTIICCICGIIPG